MVGGKEVRYLNVDMSTFKQLAIAQLEQGESVWFGCDVGQSSTRDSGVMALDVYDMDDLFDVDFTMTKAQRLDYGESLMTHAMVLTESILLMGNQRNGKSKIAGEKKLAIKDFL